MFRHQGGRYHQAPLRYSSPHDRIKYLRIGLKEWNRSAEVHFPVVSGVGVDDSSAYQLGSTSLLKIYGDLVQTPVWPLFHFESKRLEYRRGLTLGEISIRRVAQWNTYGGQ